MRVEQITLKGTGKMNEDAYVLNEQAKLFGVVDGVSSLVPYISEDNHTGGFIAANLVKQYMEERKESGSLADHVHAVNEQLARRMAAAGIDPAQKEALWGAALALVAIEEDAISYIQTGDCMIFAIYRTGKIRVLTHPQTDHIEAYALQKWTEGVRQGLQTREELYQLVKDDLIANRQRSNQPDGYGVLNGEKDVLRWCESGRINRTNLQAIILLTDGLFMPSKKKYEESSWEETVQPILTDGLMTYANRLQELEDGDPECIHYPRFKKSDDKTGIVIHF